MRSNVIFGFAFTLYTFSSVTLAHEYAVPQDEDGLYLPINSDLIVPSQDEHHIGSIYIPTYHQETTYTFPEYEPNNEVEENDDEDKDKSFITTIFELLHIPKKVMLVTTSGILWIYKNVVMLLVGMVATVALCTYGQLCTISWQPPMAQFRMTINRFRSLATADHLEAAASFVNEAIKKYKNLQNRKIIKP